MRAFYLLGYAAGLVVDTAARPWVEAAQLRAENNALEAECDALAAVADDLARQIATHRRECRR